MRIKRSQIKYIQIGTICILLVVCGIFMMPHKKTYNYNTDPSQFSFEVNYTSKARQPITVNPEKMVMYLDYFNSYKCPYYTDRADLICPEINRLAQFMRGFGTKIIFHTLTEKPTKTKSRTDFDMNIDLHLDETSPKLEDKCLYSDFNIKPAEENGSIHHDLKYSRNFDYFADTTETAAKIIEDLKVTHVIVGGMKCNYWLPRFIEHMKKIGVSLLYIYDLSDVVYFREAQVKVLDTHTKALSHFWNWVLKNGGAVVNHFSLLDRPIPKKSLSKDIDFDGNLDSYYFYEYAGKEI